MLVKIPATHDDVCYINLIWPYLRHHATPGNDVGIDPFALLLFMRDDSLQQTDEVLVS